MEMREEQHIEIGKEKVKKIKKSLCLIDWMPQSAVALYIYRVSGLAPQEILL